MADLTYLLDTNVISALIRKRGQQLTERIRQAQTQSLILPEPVVFEIVRGLLHRGAPVQLGYFRATILPQFDLVSIQLADWHTAAAFWAYTRSRGYQLSDIDLLLAAMAVRLGAILVTNDSDFDYLPMIQTEDWS